MTIKDTQAAGAATLTDAQIKKLEAQPVARTDHCQGPECRDGIRHKSDCAIHNGDALPVGPCDCGAAPSAQDSAAPSSLSAEQGPFVVERHIRTGYRGGKRADGWSIKRDGKLIYWDKYKTSAQEKADELNAKEQSNAR